MRDEFFCEVGGEGAARGMGSGADICGDQGAAQNAGSQKAWARVKYWFCRVQGLPIVARSNYDGNDPAAQNPFNDPGPGQHKWTHHMITADTVRGVRGIPGGVKDAWTRAMLEYQVRKRWLRGAFCRTV